MLVLSRKVGERIQIGDQITITVVRIASGGVRIGIDAPPHFAVVREELANRIAAAVQANASIEAGEVGSAGCDPSAPAADTLPQPPRKPK